MTQTPEWECPEKGCRKRISTVDPELFRVAVISHMKGHGKRAVFATDKKKRDKNDTADVAADVVEVVVTSRSSGAGSSGGGGFWSFLDDLF